MFGLGGINVWIRVGQPKWKGFGLGKGKKKREEEEALRCLLQPEQKLFWY